MHKPSSYLHGKDPSSEPSPNGSYPLLCHLLDTAVVATYLWDSWLRPALKNTIIDALGSDPEVPRNTLRLAAALHDIGKINSFFQYQERREAESGFADLLRTNLGLPPTSTVLTNTLNIDPRHPLRRHEFLSHRIVTGQWATSNETIYKDTWLGMLVGGHHGFWRPPRKDGISVSDLGDPFVSGAWSEQQQATMTIVEGALGFGRNDVPNLTGQAAPVVFVVLSGLLTLADWIASDSLKVDAGKSLFERVNGGPDDPHLSADAAAGWMITRRDELEAHAAHSLGTPLTADRSQFESAINGKNTPRPLQEEAMHLGDDVGLWVCMYPTGDGKTNAALLRSALDVREGFFFGLPTMATTDAMESTLREVSDRLDGGLPLIKSHQLASMLQDATEVAPATRDDSDDECCDQANPQWYTSSIRKLLAPNVVATCDQALAGALAQRHITLRLMGLANHHVILDEVHTYDPYQTALLLELLHWWGATATRVTLLSATLPEAHVRKMAQAYRAGVMGRHIAGMKDYDEAFPVPAPGFPATLFVSADRAVDDESAFVVKGPRRAVKQPPTTLFDLSSAPTADDRVGSHVEWAKQTASEFSDSPIAIIVNTVGDCMSIAQRLARDESVTATHDVVCVHSSLVTAHRLAVEDFVVDRAGKDAHQEGFDSTDADRRPPLIVGTQAVQASLDFDVDFLSTDLAPAPDLLQRLGRQWRFGGC